MSWDISIKGFKSYIQIEHSLSENSIDSYIRDVRKLGDFCIKRNINTIDISRKELTKFLEDLNSIYFLKVNFLILIQIFSIYF